MYNLTIVSMFKNESLILEEWISYYIRQGVEHFYLIDNGSTDNYESKLKPYMDKITLVKDPFHVEYGKKNILKSYDSKKNEYVFNESDCHAQILLANNYFLETIKNRSIWTMYIDTDEYIYIPKSKNIQDYLVNHIDTCKKYDNICDIFVPWKSFGSNNLEKQPKSIIQGFDKRMDNRTFQKKAFDHGNIRGFGKSITRTKHLTLLNIHKSNFCVDYLTLMPNDIILPGDSSHLYNINYNIDYNQNFIHCNHYQVMSKEYFFNHKIKRGRGCKTTAAETIPNKYWDTFNINDEIDTMLIQYVNTV